MLEMGLQVMVIFRYIQKFSAMNIFKIRGENWFWDFQVNFKKPVWTPICQELHDPVRGFFRSYHNPVGRYDPHLHEGTQQRWGWLACSRPVQGKQGAGLPSPQSFPVQVPSPQGPLLAQKIQSSLTRGATLLHKSSRAYSGKMLMCFLHDMASWMQAT